MTGGATQDVHVTPGYGPWKPTFSRSTTDWATRPTSRMMEAARGNGDAPVSAACLWLMVVELEHSVRDLECISCCVLAMQALCRVLVRWPTRQFIRLLWLAWDKVSVLASAATRSMELTLSIAFRSILMTRRLKVCFFFFFCDVCVFAFTFGYSNYELLFVLSRIWWILR